MSVGCDVKWWNLSRITISLKHKHRLSGVRRIVSSVKTAMENSNFQFVFILTTDATNIWIKYFPIRPYGLKPQHQKINITTYTMLPNIFLKTSWRYHFKGFFSKQFLQQNHLIQKHNKCQNALVWVLNVMCGLCIFVADKIGWCHIYLFFLCYNSLMYLFFTTGVCNMEYFFFRIVTTWIICLSDNEQMLDKLIFQYGLIKPNVNN